MFDFASSNPDFWFIIAQIFGLVGLVLMLISFQINHKRKLLNLQVVASLMHSLQYLCLNAASGCCMSALAAARNLLFSRFSKIPKLAVAVITLGIIVLTIAFYDGPLSLLPGLATITYTLSFASNNLTLIRLGDVIACIFYIIYNICVGAYTGLAATALEMLFTLVAMLRFDLPHGRPKSKTRAKSRSTARHHTKKRPRSR